MRADAATFQAVTSDGTKHHLCYFNASHIRRVELQDTEICEQESTLTWCADIVRLCYLKVMWATPQLNTYLKHNKATIISFTAQLLLELSSQSMVLWASRALLQPPKCKCQYFVCRVGAFGIHRRSSHGRWQRLKMLINPTADVVFYYKLKTF